MGLTEKERLTNVLNHLKVIRDKTAELDSTLNSLKTQINNNVVLNSEGYKMNQIDSLQVRIKDVTTTFNNNTIPNIKKRIDG